MSIFLLLFIFLLTQVYCDELIPTLRIFGGNEVEPKFKYSFMASLEINKFSYCGGTLINHYLVLTAAHCVPVKEYVTVEAVIHRHNLELDDKQEKGIRRKVIDYRIHPGFNKTTVFNDLALLRLDKPVPLNPHIFLDTGKIPPTKEKVAKVIGWGSTSAFNTPSKLLLETSVPFFDSDQCRSIYKKAKYNINTDIQVCFGYPQGGHDACQGDSGGPLFINRNERTVLIGTVSWGVGCAKPNSPGVYTRIGAFLPWIKTAFK